MENDKYKNIDFDYLVPVPLHWTRFIKRGYNQTEVIAQEISKLSNKPVKNILKRIKYTKYQSSLNSQGRVQNLKNAFSLYPDQNIYSGKNLLIVDDLLTSGSTLLNAAKELAN